MWCSNNCTFDALTQNALVEECFGCVATNTERGVQPNNARTLQLEHLEELVVAARSRESVCEEGEKKLWFKVGWSVSLLAVGQQKCELDALQHRGQNVNDNVRRRLTLIP